MARVILQFRPTQGIHQWVPFAVAVGLMVLIHQMNGAQCVIHSHGQSTLHKMRVRHFFGSVSKRIHKSITVEQPRQVGKELLLMM